MKYDVLNRWTGAVQFTATITCPASADPSVKLGLAVQWAYKTGANLVGARLVGARLDVANLVGARLVGANLDGARLVGARLVGANLDGANLVGARLDGANLDGANLDGANLVGARLDVANLVGANLVGANLVGANLDGANLVGANLENQNGDLVKIAALVARSTRIDGYEFILWRLEDGSGLIKAGCQTNTIEGYREHVAAQYPDTAKARETLAILDYFSTRLKDTVPANAASTEQVAA